MTAQRLLGIPVAGIVALLAVVVLVAIVLSQPRQTDSSTSRTTEALTTELRELRRSNERTAAALGRLETLLETWNPAPAARTPLGELPTPESFEVLARSLDALRLTFERESSETQELIRAAPALGGEKLTDVRDRRAETDWLALAGLEERWRRDEDQADRSQFFQTPRDLLEAYGPPTAIYRPKGSMLFYYRREPEGVPGPSWYFRLQDGIVVEFFVEDETGDSDGS